MSKITLNIGTVSNDGTGTPLREAGDSINKMTTELYEFRNKMHDLSSFVINDEDDLYAHESQILIQRIESKALLLVIYKCDKVDESEQALTGHIVLKVFELTTKTHLKTLDLFSLGLVAGITIPDTSYLWLGRMYVSGTTLKIFANNANTVFTRSIDISSSDAASWTASNVSIAQMIMKNASNENELLDVTSANIQCHLEKTLGDTNADYNNNVLFFRNLDKIAVNGSAWYATLEGYGTVAKNIMVASTDSGATWTLGGLVAYTTSSRPNMMEMSIVFIGTVLHAIARTGGNPIYHCSSVNNGVTWSPVDTVNLPTLATKPVAINYYTGSNRKSVIVALNLISEIVDNNYRTTLAVYKTDDFVSFVEIAKIVSSNYAHYPSLCHFSRSLYISYSKGLKFLTDGVANTASNRNTIVVARLY